MQNLRSFELSSLLAIGFLSLTGCSLPAPKGHAQGDAGGMTGTVMCDDEVDGGTGGMDAGDEAGNGNDGGNDAPAPSDDGGDAGNDINRIITPVSCAGPTDGTNPNAI